MRTRKKKWERYALPKGFAERRYPKDSSYITTRKSMMGHKNPNYGYLMTHKYRGCIVVLPINKSVEPNEEQKVLTSSFDQGFTVNTSKRVFRGI
jgi:hypothetical protein